MARYYTREMQYSPIQKKRILIIDPRSAEIVRQRYDAHAYGPATIYIAHSFHGAIGIANRYRPDVVIFCHTMLSFEGNYFPDLIREMLPESTIVVSDGKLIPAVAATPVFA